MQYQVNGLPEIPIAYTRIPKASVLHQHSILSDLPDFGGVKGLASKPPQEILGFLAIHCGQVASQLQSEFKS